jgi:hypothetical protein
MSAASMHLMFVEITRLLLGLLIALFHRPIADYILEHERSLVIMFRQRGLAFPATPSTETVRTVYFFIGIFVAVFEIVRIWVTVH